LGNTNACTSLEESSLLVTRVLSLGALYSGRMDAMIEDFGDTSGEAFVVAEAIESRGIAELYDSGCTNHISPFRDRLENFGRTSPRSFKAANKETFSTIGRGIWLSTYQTVIPSPNCDLRCPIFPKRRLHVGINWKA